MEKIEDIIKYLENLCEEECTCDKLPNFKLCYHCQAANSLNEAYASLRYDYKMILKKKEEDTRK
jgi:hypothetical protein